MSTIDIHYVTLPEGWRAYSYGDPCAELDEWDKKTLAENQVDAVWYWYEAGSYEGSGAALIKKDGKWYVHDMGHCSCYGPWENLSLDRSYDGFDEILASGTKEANHEVIPLIDAARMNVA